MKILEDKFGKPSRDVIFEKLLALFGIKKKIEETNNQYISRCRQLYNDINSAKVKFGDGVEIAITESLLVVIIINGLSKENQDAVRKWNKNDLTIDLLEARLSLQGTSSATPIEINMMKSKCEICNKFGHTKSKCWHNKDNKYEPKKSKQHRGKNKKRKRMSQSYYLFQLTMA